MKKLSIIIVNWNTEKEVTNCLLSIEKFAHLDETDVYVVDNNSADNSVEVILEKFDWVILTKNNDNLGFGKANNQILRKVKTEFVFILNPDTSIEKNTLSILESFIVSHIEVGLCGPQLLNPDRTIQDVGYYQKFPSLLQVIFFYTQLSLWSYKKEWLKKWLLLKKNYIDGYFEVDQIPGACMFGRIKTLKKIGFFDESFPLWFEDVDLCYRLRKIGVILAMVPESQIMHIGGSSFEKWKDSEAKQIRLFTSLIHFFDMHFGLLSQVTLRCIIWLDLSLLLIRKIIGQLVSYNKERGRFIEEKWHVLKALLVL